MSLQLQSLVDNLKECLSKKEQLIHAQKVSDAATLSLLSDRMHEIQSFENGTYKFDAMTSSIEKKTILESFTNKANEIIKSIDEIK